MDLAKKGYFENANATPTFDEQPNFNFDSVGVAQNTASPGYGVDSRAQGRLRPKRGAIKQTGGYPDEDLARGIAISIGH